MNDSESSVVTSVKPIDQGMLIKLDGEIDLHHSPELHLALKRLCDEQPAKLVIDLSGVTYLDSSGVGTLVDIFRRANGYSGQMILVGPQQRVRSIFELTKLDRFFTILDSEQEALDR